MGTEGYEQLVTPLGIFVVFASGIILTWIIYFGARLVRYKEIADKKYRAELKQEVEEGRRPV